MQEDTMIELRELSCKVGHKFLLNHINWSVKRGEHWIVFGMNGSGKTTLLSVIAGYKKYSAGELQILGNTVTEDNILALRKKIGWVSASFFDKYYSKESVLDIVLSGKYGTLGVDGLVSVFDIKRAKALLYELGLKDRENHGFDMLSKGERQNVLIARALFSNPEILILDEPCTGLDVYNREYLFQTLNKLSEKNILTIIYVTHYVEEVLPIFQKCLLLKNGRIFAQGNTVDNFVCEVFSEFLDCNVILNKNNDKYELQIEHVQTRISDLLE